MAAKVTFDEKFWKLMDGSQTIDRLTVLINGEEAASWRKPDISGLQNQDPATLKGALSRYMMGALRPLPPADQEAAIKKVIEKLMSYKI